MEQTTIIRQLEPIFRDVLDNDDITLKPETIAEDIEEWDSLNHIQLMVAIEKNFKIKFTTSEIQQLKNVGELCDKINAKLSVHS